MPVAQIRPESVAHNEHAHKCTSCQTVWKHHDATMFADTATFQREHSCPNCGCAQRWKAYFEGRAWRESGASDCSTSAWQTATAARPGQTLDTDFLTELARALNTPRMRKGKVS